MDNFTSEQIKAALVEPYRVEYEKYFILEEVAKELLQCGENEAHRVIARQAKSVSDIMYGMKKAAAALGISEDEFLAIVKK